MTQPPPPSHTPSHTTASLAQHVTGDLVGPGDLAITGLAELVSATPGDLSFIGEARYVEAWNTSNAAAALVGRDIDTDPGPGRALIRVDNADLAMAAVLELFAPPPSRPDPGIHPSAVIDPTARIAPTAHIGPGCNVEAGVVIGDHTVLDARVTIENDAVIGDHGRLKPGVFIGARCTLGHHCRVGPNTVVGSQGFGYRPGDTDAGQLPVVRIPHLGAVTIGNHVEIGAATCIDRGKFGNTTIDDFTKLDNLVQIAHNVHLGKAVMLAGCTGIAGSCTVGDGTRMGGGVGIADHRTIGKGVDIGGGSGVMHDIPDNQTWAGYPAKPLKVAAREELAVQKLPDLLKKVRKLERSGGL